MKLTLFVRDRVVVRSYGGLIQTLLSSEKLSVVEFRLAHTG